MTSLLKLITHQSILIVSPSGQPIHRGESVDIDLSGPFPMLTFKDPGLNLKYRNGSLVDRLGQVWHIDVAEECA